MSAVLELACRLVSEICCDCGVQFAMPEAVQRRRREDRAIFYCPAGHPQHYTGKTEAAVLKEKLEAKERELARANEREEYLRRQRKTLEHRLHGTQGALTKVKKRVGVGVCPCCNRTFKQLAAHMTSKHPDYSKTGGEP